MDADGFGRLLTQGNFCPVDAIDGRISSRCTSNCEHPVFRDKPQVHKLSLNLFREVQRGQRGAGSNSELAESSGWKHAWHGGRVVLAIRGESSIATGKVVYQLYDPSLRMTMLYGSSQKGAKGRSSGSSDSHGSGRKMGYDDRRVPCLLARISTPGGPVGLAQGSLVGCQGKFRSRPRYRPGRRVRAGSSLGSCLPSSQGRRPGQRGLLVQARSSASSGNIARRRMASDYNRPTSPPRKLDACQTPAGKFNPTYPHCPKGPCCVSILHD
jgi:hypothetical protein